MTDELSDTPTGTMTREAWLRAQEEAPAVHFVAHEGRGWVEE